MRRNALPLGFVAGISAAWYHPGLLPPLSGIMMSCIGEEETSLLDLLGRDAAVKRGRVDIVVGSPDGETFTLAASEPEVRFALGLLPNAPLPSPKNVSARLTGDLPGEVTLALAYVRRSTAMPDAAASLRDGRWVFGPFPTAALGQEARRMSTRLSQDGLLPLSWKCIEAVARPGSIAVEHLIATPARSRDGRIVLPDQAAMGRLAVLEQPCATAAPVNRSSAKATRSSTARKTAAAPAVGRGNRMRLTFGARARCGVVIPPKWAVQAWREAGSAVDIPLRIAPIHDDLYLVSAADALFDIVGSADAILRRGDRNWYARVSVSRLPDIPERLAQRDEDSPLILTEGEDFVPEAVPGRIVLRGALAAADREGKLERAAQLMSEAFSLLAEASSDPRRKKLSMLFSDGRGAVVGQLPPTAVSALIAPAGKDAAMLKASLG